MVTMEPADAAPDLVGRTSARLAADGVERRDRLAALHLLAVLDASTDTTGRVRRPLDDLAAEFELPALSVLRSLDHLEHAGAVRREGSNVVILGRDEGGIGGLQLADFLEDVRAALEPGIAPIDEHRSPWLVRTGAALVAVAAAFAVLTLAPSSPTTVTNTAARPTASSSSSTTGLGAPTTAAGAGATSSTVAAATSEGEAAATTTVAPSIDSGVVAAGECPTGTPITEVVGTVVRITNPTDADLVVTSLTVNGAPLATVVSVPAGQTVRHELPVAAPTASVDEWHWADPTVARDCG
jgi:hypothetical protein